MLTLTSLRCGSNCSFAAATAVAAAFTSAPPTLFPTPTVTTDARQPPVSPGWSAAVGQPPPAGAPPLASHPPPPPPLPPAPRVDNGTGAPRPPAYPKPAGSRGLVASGGSSSSADSSRVPHTPPAYPPTVAASDDDDDADYAPGGGGGGDTMVDGMRRSRLCDVTIVCFALIAFTAVPFGLMRTPRYDAFDSFPLEAAFVASTGAGWALLAAGAAPLLYFYCSGRRDCSTHLPAATTGQLGVIAAAAAAAVVGIWALAAAEVVWLVQRILNGWSWWHVSAVVAVLMLLWLSYAAWAVVVEARYWRKVGTRGPVGGMAPPMSPAVGFV